MQDGKYKQESISLSSDMRSAVGCAVAESSKTPDQFVSQLLQQNLNVRRELSCLDDDGGVMIYHGDADFSLPSNLTAAIDNIAHSRLTTSSQFVSDELSKSLSVSRALLNL